MGWSLLLQVDFDKTKHLSDKSVRQRELERKKIKTLLLEKERKKQAEREYEEKRKHEAAYVLQSVTRAPAQYYSMLFSI